MSASVHFAVMDLSCFLFGFQTQPRPPSSTLFPYTTLFRSKAYFDVRDGIGYTLARTNIHSCDFSSSSYTYVDEGDQALRSDRKSTRLNSSHANISYAVFCLKKKTKNRGHTPARRIAFDAVM